MGWIRSSCWQAIGSAMDSLDDMGIQVQEQFHMQRHFMKAFQIHHFPVATIVQQIKHRVRLLVAATEAQTSQMLELTKQSSKAIPQYIVLTFVRAWCNAWCTAKRMGQSGPCPFVVWTMGLTLATLLFALLCIMLFGRQCHTPWRVDGLTTPV